LVISGTFSEIDIRIALSVVNDARNTGGALTTVVTVAVVMIATTLVVDVELLAGSAAVWVLGGGAKFMDGASVVVPFWIGKPIQVELIHIPKNHVVLV